VATQKDRASNFTPIVPVYNVCAEASTNVLWIRNCRHALGGLADSRWTLLHMQQRSAGGRRGRYFQSMTSHQKSHSVNRCAFTWRISSPSSLKWLFWRAPTTIRTRRTTTSSDRSSAGGLEPQTTPGYVTGYCLETVKSHRAIGAAQNGYWVCTLRVPKLLRLGWLLKVMWHRIRHAAAPEKTAPRRDRRVWIRRI